MHDLAQGPEVAEFRYIVIGGGSAGCLLARRLAERQSGTVALVEAGPVSSDVRTVVPIYYPQLFGSSLDWGFSTEPQPGLGGRQIAWPRGKMLGGSGAINAMIFLQPAEEDFRRWNWHWAAAYEREATEGGLLPHQPLHTPHPWSEAFVQAGHESGLQIARHFERSLANSCGFFSLAQQSGRRAHTGLELSQLQNLTLFTSCQVQRVCIPADRATGVLIRDALQQTVTLLATDEVILCGGTIGSPLLLFASGIGSESELRQLGIHCQYPLKAVGANLQDHLVFPVVLEARTNMGLPRRHSRNAREQFRRMGQGPMVSNLAEAGALLGAAANNGSDFQIHFTPTHYLKYPRSPTKSNHFSLAVTDLHPLSRGRLSAARTQTSNAATSPHTLAPRIDPGYLSDGEDLERMQSAIAWARHLAQQPSLQALVAQELMPGATRQNATSLRRTLMAFAQSIYHPVGTCRMVTPMESSIEHTVVDAEFRVHGIDGLRIADASVLPDLPSGNTNAVTLILAARAADLILAGS
jgi:choline dehydrogenase